MAALTPTADPPGRRRSGRATVHTGSSTSAPSGAARAYWPRDRPGMSPSADPSAVAPDANDVGQVADTNDRWPISTSATGRARERMQSIQFCMCHRACHSASSSLHFRSSSAWFTCLSIHGVARRDRVRPRPLGPDPGAPPARGCRVIRFSAHLGTLFPELPPLERPAAAAAAGFGEVEAWWPPAPAADDWIAAVRAAGVRAVLVNADGGDLAAGERGFCNVPGREDEVLAAVRAAARVVRACGGETVNLLVGRYDPARPRGVQRDAAAEVVRAAGDEARAVGRPHRGGAPERPRRRRPAARDARRRGRPSCEAVGHDAVRVLYDAYHAARAGLDPVAEIDRVAGLIGHVQYADSPGRGAPGTGDGRPAPGRRAAGGRGLRRAGRPRVRPRRADRRGPRADRRPAGCRMTRERARGIAVAAATALGVIAVAISLLQDDDEPGGPVTSAPVTVTAPGSTAPAAPVTASPGAGGERLGRLRRALRPTSPRPPGGTAGGHGGRAARPSWPCGGPTARCWPPPRSTSRAGARRALLRPRGRAHAGGRRRSGSRPRRDGGRRPRALRIVGERAGRLPLDPLPDPLAPRHRAHAPRHQPRPRRSTRDPEVARHLERQPHPLPRRSPTPRAPASPTPGRAGARPAATASAWSSSATSTASGASAPAPSPARSPGSAGGRAVESDTRIRPVAPGRLLHRLAAAPRHRPAERDGARGRSHPRLRPRLQPRRSSCSRASPQRAVGGRILGRGDALVNNRTY